MISTTAQKAEIGVKCRKAAAAVQAIRKLKIGSAAFDISSAAFVDIADRIII